MLWQVMTQNRPYLSYFQSSYHMLARLAPSSLVVSHHPFTVKTGRTHILPLRCEENRVQLANSTLQENVQLGFIISLCDLQAHLVLTTKHE